tara:strand:- start:20006 stop:21481 length:1476 start_codon:yes stop_codon:yes gene_type:complete
MNLFDYFGDINAFGAGPDARAQSLLDAKLITPEAMESANKRSIGTGIMTGIASYLAQPKNQNYGSVVPYLGKAYLNANQAAQAPFQGMTDKYLMDTKIAENQRVLGQRSKTKEVLEQMILQQPDLAYLRGAPDAQVLSAINEFTKLKMTPTKIKAPTSRTIEMLNDAGTPDDTSDDYLEKVVQEFDDTTGKYKEINRSPKEILPDHVEFTDEAIELAASGFVLDGKLPPMGRGKSANSDRRKIINRATEIIKESGGDITDARLQAILNKTEFKSREIALKNFSTGVEGRKTRSLNTAMAHLESMKEWSIALNNTDVRKVNAVKQQLSKEFGDPDVTNFDFAKQIVADEVLVAVVQAGGSMQERQELSESFDRANTPDQLLGVIETAHELMAGQLESLGLQYESSVGEDLAKRNPFVKKLSPKTRKLYERFRIGGDTESKRPKDEQVTFNLENPKPEDKEFVDMYLKDPNSTTGKQIKKALIQRGYKIEENL